MKSILLSLFILISFCLPVRAEFYTKCDRGINLGDKDSFKTLSGPISCYNDKGGVVEAAILTNGAITTDTHYQNGIKQSTENFKNGKKNGVSEIYYEDTGKLKALQNFSDDQLTGIDKEFFEDGKTISHLGYQNPSNADQDSYVNFNKRSSPIYVSCGKTPPSDFAKYCTQPTQLYDDDNHKTQVYVPEGIHYTGVVKAEDGEGHVVSTETYKDGALNGQRKVFDSKGNPLLSENYENGDMAGKRIMYFENTRKIESIVYVDPASGIARRSEDYYMNGQMKELEESLSGKTYIVKRFYDDGKPESETTYQRKSDCSYYFCFDKPIGTGKRYDNDGSLSVITYDVDGNVAKTIDYDASGKLKETKSYYPDGSQKR